MPGAENDLQLAVHTALVADTTLTGLLGGAHVYDQLPPRIDLPLVLFGPLAAFDWSTSSDSGDEIEFTTEIWSSKRGKAEALQIARRVREVMETVEITGGQNRLVLLEYVSGETEFDEQANAFQCRQRFRALIESVS